MSAQPLPTPAATTGNSPDQQAAADTRFYRATLHELIEMGTDLARAVHKQAMAQAEAAPTAAKPAIAKPTAGQAVVPAPALTVNLATAFDRLSRCVRRTVLLAQRIAHPPKAAPAAGPNRTAARTRILRAVEDAINHRAFTTRTPVDTDALHAELHERLDSPELDDDIASRPIPDIITEIVRDLGIAFKPFGVCPARRRTPHDIRAMRARAAAPIGAAPPTPPPVPKPPTPPQTAAHPPASVMVPIPDDPPPDLAEMLALCAQLVGDG